MDDVRTVYLADGTTRVIEVPAQMTLHSECNWRSFERVVGDETGLPFIDDVDTGGLGSNADN